MLRDLIELELGRVAWVSLRGAGHATAASVPTDFRAMLVAKDDAAALAARGRLEESIGVQSVVVEAAPHLVPAICFALLDPSVPMPARAELLDLLYWIARGEVSGRESRTANPLRGSACTQRVRDFVMVLYSLLDGPMSAEAIEVIALVETDPERLAWLERHLPPGAYRG